MLAACRSQLNMTQRLMCMDVCFEGFDCRFGTAAAKLFTVLTTRFALPSKAVRFLKGHSANFSCQSASFKDCYSVCQQFDNESYLLGFERLLFCFTGSLHSKVQLQTCESLFTFLISNMCNKKVAQSHLSR